MEEVMMMTINTPNSPINQTISEHPITTTTCSSWKLYENPFYSSHSHRHGQSNKRNPHRLHLPVSARKIAASFWDLSLSRRIMESELEIARAQIIELKVELEYERKARKKMETLNKRLAKELTEERRGREAMERVCEALARQISSEKSEIDRMKKEMEEERKMLRMAEVLREERVQMKLAEAKFLLEEKLLELEEMKRTQIELPTTQMEMKNQEKRGSEIRSTASVGSFSGKFARLVLSEKSCDDNNGVDTRESTSVVPSEKSICQENSCNVTSMGIQRKASPDPENPHIRRGIKGFVEFPRVVRAMGSRSRNWSTKLECQRAQLKILVKQKSPIRSNSLIMS